MSLNTVVRGAQLCFSHLRACSRIKVTTVNCGRMVLTENSLHSLHLRLFVHRSLWLLFVRVMAEARSLAAAAAAAGIQSPSHSVRLSMCARACVDTSQSTLSHSAFKITLHVERRKRRKPSESHQKHKKVLGLCFIVSIFFCL